jgi:hypothetical protein
VGATIRCVGRITDWPLVGRSGELEVLEQRLADGASGSTGSTGSTVVVGESGVGKSRLLDEAIAGARLRTVRVLGTRSTSRSTLSGQGSPGSVRRWPSAQLTGPHQGDLHPAATGGGRPSATSPGLTRYISGRETAGDQVGPGESDGAEDGRSAGGGPVGCGRRPWWRTPAGGEGQGQATTPAAGDRGSDDSGQTGHPAVATAVTVGLSWSTA